MTRRNMKFLSQIFCAVFLFTGTALGAAFQFGGLRLDAIRVTSSGSATQLTKADKQVRAVTGTANDTQKLPDATTLQDGYWYHFTNESTGYLTVSNSSSTVLGSLAERESAFLFLSSNGTTGGPWIFAKSPQPDNAACKTISASDIDWNAVGQGGCFVKPLSGNITLTFSNRPPAHKTIIIRLTNTASNYTVAWPTANVLWSGGSAPTQTVGAKTDVITCDHDGTTTLCNSVQDF